MRVLVLNSSWYPVAQCDWQHAFKLIMTDKAKVVEYYEDKFVRTPTAKYQVPAVIHLTSYGSIPRRKVGYSKLYVFERDKYMCQYCGKKIIHDKATIDHVTPRSRGGKTTFENTVTACAPCNTKKASKTPEQAGMKLLSVPKKPGHISPLVGRIRTVEKEWKNYLGNMLGEKN
jgi:5-methylcytosine-specific restriction endonuclease McrA